MKFSLILGTKGRTTELVRFLQALSAQQPYEFELIVIDQNIDDRLFPIIDLWKRQMSIKHLWVSFQGLSRARNVGLAYATGDLIAFPDDDCWYPNSLLANVAEWFDRNPQMDGLTGRSQSGDGRSSQIDPPAAAGLISRHNVWSRAISYSIFLRRQVIETVGQFDESLGVGAGTPWGSGEETDYLLCALSKGFQLRYDPSVWVFHPALPSRFNEQLCRRGLNYGAGMGRVLRKHQAPLWFVIYILLRALGGVFLGGVLMRLDMCRFHWNVFRGRLKGLSAWQHSCADR